MKMDLNNGKLVVGTTGLPGSGKSRVGQVGREFGFYVITGGDVIREIANRKEIESTDRNLASLTETLRDQNGEGIIAKKCIAQMDDIEGDRFIIDSFRKVEEVEVCLEKFGEKFHMIEIKAPFDERYERLSSRDRSDDVLSKTELRKRDDRENEWGTKDVSDLADYSIENDSSIEDFEREVRDVLEEIISQNRL